jgi:hypothetical protein
VYIRCAHNKRGRKHPQAAIMNAIRTPNVYSYQLFDLFVFNKYKCVDHSLDGLPQACTHLPLNGAACPSDLCVSCACSSLSLTGTGATRVGNTTGLRVGTRTSVAYSHFARMATRRCSKTTSTTRSPTSSSGQQKRQLRYFFKCIQCRAS